MVAFSRYPGGSTGAASSWRPTPIMVGREVRPVPNKNDSNQSEMAVIVRNWGVRALISGPQITGGVFGVVVLGVSGEQTY